MKVLCRTYTIIELSAKERDTFGHFRDMFIHRAIEPLGCCSSQQASLILRFWVLHDGPASCEAAEVWQKNARRATSTSAPLIVHCRASLQIQQKEELSSRRQASMATGLPGKRVIWNPDTSDKYYDNCISKYIQVYNGIYLIYFDILV